MNENVELQLETIEESLDRINVAAEAVLDKSFIIGEPDAKLGQKVKDVEKTVQNIDVLAGELQEAFSLMINALSFEIGNMYRTELDEIRQNYLEEETDTAREAAELIEEYLKNPDPRLLMASLGWIKTQVPPTVEEIEYIPFETARIDDANLDIGVEHVEVEGVDGEYKVTYEIGSDEERIEIGRELTKQPVTAVIRVGTKEAEVEPEE